MFSSQNSQVSSANYIEDVFSTYLYNGTGSAQTITNGIDLSTKGGLVWGKMRNDSGNNFLQDTARGTGQTLCSNNTDGNTATSTYITAFNSTGFTLGTNLTVNGSSYTYASWTFRKQPKFYTQGTYTGTGSVQNIAHDLGSVPGCIIVKDTTNNGSAWAIYHTSLGNTKYLQFTTDAAGTSSGYWNNTSPTSTQFTVGTNGNVNQSGATYVYYAFAHDAGGFGLTGTDNVISCGSFTDTTTVNLGYEPQWVLFKKSSSSSIGDWFIADNMRGFSETSINTLSANTSSAEASYSNTGCVLTSTGFTYNTGLAGSGTFIYIAIRRGPMKVPTSGTSVFLPTSRTGNASLTTVTSDFATDVVLARRRDTLDNTNESVFADKLRGSGTLSTTLTDAEYAGGATSGLNAYTNTGVVIGTNNNPIYAFNYSGLPYALYQFQRAPSFFDEVCYTGTGSARTVTHNLGVVPELMIVKKRSAADAWIVYANNDNTDYLVLNTTAATVDDNTIWNDTSPTASVFTVGTNDDVNGNTATFVAYLFATCPGVSKVGTYTGTGSTLQIDCGFTGGARFVLIKRTDSTGDWYVWDSARGIVSGNDPYLLLNSTAAEVTNTDYIDTYSAGFEISSTAPAAINASGGTFIFLAIA